MNTIQEPAPIDMLPIPKLIRSTNDPLPIEPDETIKHVKEKKKQSKEKLAQYARTYYQKRADSDPEFLKILNERVKSNRNKRLNLDAPRKVGRPRIKNPIV